MSPDYRIAYVNDRRRLIALNGALASTTVVALDIETASWWDPRAERVSLVQLAYRDAGMIRVAGVMRRPRSVATRAPPVAHCATLRGHIKRHPTQAIIGSQTMAYAEPGRGPFRASKENRAGVSKVLSAHTPSAAD